MEGDGRKLVGQLMKDRRSKTGTLLWMLLLVGLAGFSAVVSNLVEAYEFGLGSRKEIAETGLKSIYYLILFAAVWCIMRRLDRNACANEIANEPCESDGSDELCKSDESGRGREAGPSGHRFPAPAWNRRSFLQCAVAIALVYIVYLAVFYPGVSNYDTANEIRDFLNGTDPLPFNWHNYQVHISYFLNDHHPVTDTFLFVFFVKIGFLLGNSSYGIALYSLVQICVTAGTFSLMLCSMDKLGIPLRWRRVGFVMFILLPFYGMYAINMIKDSVNAVFFALYFVEFVFIVRRGATGKRLIRIIILSVLVALTKKTGVYLVVLSNVFLILLRSVRRHWISWLMSILIPAFVIFILFARILFPAFNIYPGGRQEALGMPLEMVQRTFLEYPEDVTEEEQETMNALVPKEWADAHYSFTMTDELKNGYNFYATDEQIKSFLKLWKKKGLQHPDSYVKSILICNGGYLVPFTAADIYTAYRPVESFGVHTNPERFTKLRDACSEIYNGWLINTPGTDILFRICLYSWWIPMLAFARILFEKEWKDIIILIPVAGCIGILMIGPAVIFRYALGLAYVAPMILGLFSSRAGRSFTQQNSNERPA